MGLLDLIFGSRKKQIKTFLKNGAIILDVRTQREWDNGHINDSVHIPLDELKNRIDEVKKFNKSVIVVCQSGIRAAKASRFLNENNIDATNGGGWATLQTKKH
ncbi:rhodanese-like domain-containing protein [Snuella sedimenti]|uniref:Rhodanese-like domain-containing protein n=1 Tax=Snuella sedimenti TaxID=2798802 RepID=A0A8J7IGY5_9FLAO|nr:rhodanese-like domain-containing protein [Snuella sedimenti]MBJ6369782.1 rhodanese-like domain-containing protein [Snuella sedimenti]